MWEAFKDGIFAVIAAFYSFCGDWGLAIIIITVIFRVALIPLTHKQTKSSYMTQKLQPEIERIREIFADDKVRQNEEIQKLYAETHFNPLAGCIPMLIQLPIFMALFQTLSEMGQRAEVTGYTFYNLIPNLVMTPAQAWAVDFRTFVPYLILMVIFAGATFLPQILMSKGQPEQQRKQTLMMSAIMSVFMLWISWSSPAGVLLFWGVSSLIAIAMQQVSLSIVKKEIQEQEEEAALKPIEVNVTRNVKKKRPSKKR